MSRKETAVEEGEGEEKSVKTSSFSHTGDHASCPSQPSIFGLFGSKTCNWKGPIEDLPGHIAQCPHAEIPCPGGCGTRLPRKVMTTHMEGCPQCPERLVPCPNGCIKLSKPLLLPFCDIETHRMVCPKEPVPCTYADAGCTAIVLRYQLPYHEKV